MASDSPGVDLSELLERKLLIVTGKGGVGKTTVAASLAAMAADHGKRVLMVEVDAKGDLPAMFDHPAVSFKPEQVAQRIHALAMDTEEALREYLKIYAKIPAFGTVGPFAKMLDFVAQAAPGVKEILVIGKICYEVKQITEGKSNWDLVIVDAAASGHVIAQLAAARTMQRLVGVGAIQAQLEWMEALLGDPKIASMAIVAIPEEMPVAESIELAERARTEISVQTGMVFLNRRIPDIFGEADREVFERFRRDAVQASISESLGKDIETVIDGVALFDDICQEQTEHEQDLRSAVDVPVVTIPSFFVRDQGTRMIRLVSQSLQSTMGRAHG